MLTVEIKMLHNNIFSLFTLLFLVFIIEVVIIIPIIVSIISNMKPRYLNKEGNMKVKLTEKGRKIAESLKIPELVRVKFYSIFNDPNEFRIYYRNKQEFQDKIIDCCFGC